MRLGPALVLAALTAAAPVSAAGTTLYIHVLDSPIQDMPISPQEPPARYSVMESAGLGATSLGCLPNPPAGGNPFQDYSTLYAYPVGTSVDYETQLGAALKQPRVEPTRGIAGPVSLDGASPVLHWYWSTKATVPLPNVVMHVTMRAGDAISVDNQAYNSGTILAEGTSAPALLAGDQSQGVTHTKEGLTDVYEFTVPLQVKAARIDAAEGYNLRIDTYVLRDQCPANGYVMPSTLDLRSAPGERPRLELATVQAPTMQPVVPRLDNGTWTFDVRTASPWGPVDVANLTASVTGPGPVSLDMADPYVLPHYCHCLDFGAYAAMTHDSRITWDPAVDHAKPGAYVLHLRATNLQGTAAVTQDVPFTMTGQQEAPGLPMWAIALGVVGMAILVRRRA